MSRTIVLPLKFMLTYRSNMWHWNIFRFCGFWTVGSGEFEWRLPVLDLIVLCFSLTCIKLMVFYYHMHCCWYVWLFFHVYRWLLICQMCTQKIQKHLPREQTIWRNFPICMNRESCKIWQLDMNLMKYMWVIYSWLFISSSLFQLEVSFFVLVYELKKYYFSELNC